MSKIQSVSNRCPLCEVFRSNCHDSKRRNCPLVEEVGITCYSGGSLYHQWYDRPLKSKLRKWYAQKILECIEAWEVK